MAAARSAPRPSSQRPTRAGERASVRMPRPTKRDPFLLPEEDAGAVEDEQPAAKGSSLRFGASVRHAKAAPADSGDDGGVSGAPPSALNPERHSPKPLKRRSEHPAQSEAQQPRPRKRRPDEPLELSSKEPVRPFTPSFAAKRYKPRDPRFDDMCGEFNEAKFRRSYAFLDELKAEEAAQVKKLMHRTRNEFKRTQLQRVMNQYTEDLKKRKEFEEAEERRRKLREAEARLVEKGKQPYFVTKSQEKELALAQKFVKLRDSGKLEKYLAKRRQKSAARDRKWIAQA